MLGVGEGSAVVSEAEVGRKRMAFVDGIRGGGFLRITNVDR